MNLLLLKPKRVFKTVIFEFDKNRILKVIAKDKRKQRPPEVARVPLGLQNLGSWTVSSWVFPPFWGTGFVEENPGAKREHGCGGEPVRTKTISQGVEHRDARGDFHVEAQHPFVRVAVGLSSSFNSRRSSKE